MCDDNLLIIVSKCKQIFCSWDSSQATIQTRRLLSSTVASNTAEPMLGRCARLFVHSKKHSFAQMGIVDKTFDPEESMASNTISTIT